MTSISENVYINRLDNTVDEYNNSYHKTIKMKAIDVKSSIQIGFGVENNDKGPKFKMGDYVRLLKQKKIFVKVTLQIDITKFL